MLYADGYKQENDPIRAYRDFKKRIDTNQNPSIQLFYIDTVITQARSGFKKIQQRLRKVSIECLFTYYLSLCSVTRLI